MTEPELIVEIAAVQTAITNQLKTGNEYEMESGKSRRRFKAVSIPELRAYLSQLNQQLQEVQGNSGFVGIY